MNKEIVCDRDDIDASKYTVKQLVEHALDKCGPVFLEFPSKDPDVTLAVVVLPLDVALVACEWVVDEIEKEKAGRN